MMVRKIKNAYDEWRLTINMSKTEHLTENMKAYFLLDGTDINFHKEMYTVKEFKYIRSIIHEDGSYEIDV